MARRTHIELRIHFIGLLIVAAAAALIMRLWWIQVARGEKYTAKIAGRSQVTVRIPAVRGEIRDRSGTPLVQNRASYEIDFYLPDLVRDFRKKNPDMKIPVVDYKGTVRGMKKDMSEADIVKIVHHSIIPRLEGLNLAKDFNAKQLQRHYRVNTEVPYTYIEDVDFPTLAKFSEHDVGLAGVDISIKPVRQYIYGALAAHLLGYVGEPTNIDKEEASKYNFYQTDVEGKSQIEAYMDKYLKGQAGVRIMQRNAKGVIEGEATIKPPTAGNNVNLTIDLNIQFIAEQALRAVGRGAAVVLDPNNGDILAMASVPSYDPNTFIPSISAKDWSALRADETDPLTNRALGGYAPGSTYKTVTALAGFLKGLSPGTTFSCSGGVTYGSKFMKCWIAQKGGAHGGLDVSNAIKVSCNAFFYQYGNAAGIDNIVAVGKILGLGEKSNVPLTGESGGILPGPEWLRMKNPQERWSNGHTANVSIGQGFVLASPLQMAMVTSAIANGGICYEPRLISGITTPDGKELLDEQGNPVIPHVAKVRGDLRARGITPAQIEVVRRGMWKVVNEAGGTASRARIKGYEVAGKTGTAQFMRSGVQDNHTWFICFAPYNAPKYAVCVFVQGAKSGGGVSAPIAAEILEKTFAMERGYTPALAALEPARGSFKHIEQVSYENSIPAQFSADEETADHAESVQPDSNVQPGQATAQPNIKPEADEQGKVNSRNRRIEQNPEPKKRNFFQKFLNPRRRSEERSRR